MTEEAIMNRAADACEQAGCNEEATKRHVKHALDGWYVHPPQDFCAWFRTSRDYKRGGCVNEVTAWNCIRYRQEYLKAKEVGIV